eukprot:3327869-Heterocapsa_arctica.AAC.1
MMRRRTMTKRGGRRGNNTHEKDKEKTKGRRYDIEGCRACGRSSEAETPSSLLEFTSASFDVRVLD